MKKIIPISLAATLSLFAAEVTLAPIGVESTLITKVAQNAQISADVAEALSKDIPSIDMNRRSGIANDIYIRGQKRDNISVEVDGTKVCGACPNRMDPPVSHVLVNQIEEIEVTEGPYDVTTFGTMSGGLKITTKKPSKEFKGEVNAGLGSWGYKKIGATLSGGNDTVRLLLTGSTESSGQYKDGNGNTLSQQLKNNPIAVAGNNQYQTFYEDMDAYKKKSLMAKLFINIANNQELRFAYTGNRSDNIMYPSTGMDAAYDDSNIYSVSYNVTNITDIYKNANIQYYYSDVDHPMTTHFRQKAQLNPAAKYPMDVTSHLKTTMQGLKLKNDFTLGKYDILLGLDGSKRTWDGTYYKTLTGAVHGRGININDSITKNIAVFTKVKKSYENANFEVGARYDSTKITSADAAQQDNKYNGLNLNFLTTYNMDKDTKVFFGIGQASRVPDSRELYFYGPTGTENGTNNLKKSTNKEIDLGYEINNDAMNFKVKAFYSKLKDYIYFKAGGPNNFNNIDAKVYGAEISSEFFITDTFTIDTAASYKRGKKDNALEGQTDTDLADIAPLRGNIAFTYEYMNNSTVSADVLMSKSWTNYDSDNKEQRLSGWSTLNLKVQHAFSKTLDLSVGVNNIFDETYAQSNTYVDLTLINTASGVVNPMLLNEPGRYLYTNISYRF